MKSNIKKHFLLYLFWLILSILFIVWEFSILNETKKSEKINIFISCTTFHEDEMNELIDDYPKDPIKQIDYRYIEPDHALYSQVMMTYGEVDADLFILPKSKIDALECYRLFLIVDEEIAISNDDYKDEVDDRYGLFIQNDLFESEEPLYLLFSKNTSYDKIKEFASMLVDREGLS